MRGLFSLLLLVATLVGTLWAGQFGWGPTVIVNQWEHKIPLLLGAPWREPISEPGLTWRIPLVETMTTLDKRLQFLDAKPVELLIGNETLLVDYYAIWRIIDPLLFLRSYPGGIPDAERAIGRRLRSQVGATIGRMPLEQLLARAKVIDDLGSEVSVALAEKGVEVVDVRINRTELPRDAESAAYEQMREQRRAISREHRAKGEREAREIRAKTEREARTLVAEATAKSEITMGEGDAEAAAIYAAAYGNDPEFYNFVRSLEAYRLSLRQHTTMVLPPDHEFFRYLQSGGDVATPRQAP
jgi:membrane protease subunit HflC